MIAYVAGVGTGLIVSVGLACALCVAVWKDIR